MARQTQNPVNPFFTRIDIPDDFFCDRKKETEEIIQYIRNEKNIVLKSPRRLGKSSLILHIFKQPDISKHYNTLFVDVFGTKSLSDFVSEFQNALFAAPFAQTARGRKEFGNLLRNAYIQMNLAPDGLPNGFRLGLAGMPGEDFTLTQIFAFLEKTGKPNLVVFDEFQKINAYPEDAAAVIRSHVQRATNTTFIFSGSSRHMLQKMFENPDEPFYRSATSLELQPIPQEAYTQFCEEMFTLYGKSIDPEAVEFVYKLFSGNTFDMQEVMKETFMNASADVVTTRDDVTNAIHTLLDQRDTEFKAYLDRIDNQKYRRLLFCIAREGITKGLTSSAMMKRYNLDNASSVQNGLAFLMSDHINLIMKTGPAEYSLRNRFFELWIARRDHSLDAKIEEILQRETGRSE